MRTAIAGVRTRWFTRALAGLGAAALVTAGSALPASAAYPGTSGLIAFVWHGNIYTVNPAHPAGSSRRLTAGGHASGPRWSPSGLKIAYLDRGDLWVMNANGSGKTEITSTGPGEAASRPAWSPNGRYLAFVLSRRGHATGYLARYSFSSHALNFFTATLGSLRMRVAALPGAVAWAWAETAGQEFGSYIAYQGAGALCNYTGEYCLNLLGFAAQSGFRNGFPSAEDAPTTFQLTDPDWFPNSPLYYRDLMTSEHVCTGGHCTAAGLDLQVDTAPVLRGARQGVYSPAGSQLAYVRDLRGTPQIYIAPYTGLVGAPAWLAQGTEPDWQPVNLAVVS